MGDTRNNLADIVERNDKFKECLKTESHKFLEGWKTQKKFEYKLDVGRDFTGRKLLLALVSMVRHEHYQRDRLFRFYSNGDPLFTVKAKPTEQKSGNGVILHLGAYSEYKKMFSGRGFEEFVTKNAKKPVKKAKKTDENPKLMEWNLYVLLVFEIARLIPKEPCLAANPGTSNADTDATLADKVAKTSLNEASVTDKQKSQKSRVETFDDVPVAFVIYSWVVSDSADCDVRVFQSKPDKKNPYDRKKDLKGRVDAVEDVIKGCENLKATIDEFQGFFLEREDHGSTEIQEEQGGWVAREAVDGEKGAKGEKVKQEEDTRDMKEHGTGDQEVEHTGDKEGENVENKSVENEEENNTKDEEGEHTEDTEDEQTGCQEVEDTEGMDEEYSEDEVKEKRYTRKTIN